jgi:hypothetical protein
MLDNYRATLNAFSSFVAVAASLYVNCKGHAMTAWLVHALNGWMTPSGSIPNADGSYVQNRVCELLLPAMRC